MQLSDKVWNLSKQFKQELEESISVTIEPGISAVELAARIKPYLNEPDKRFRKIKDKFGHLHLSKNALAYSPERGVYRSSARNAQRLARTEINMAYRTAEQLRWSQMDFVVGYEVKPTQNGKHVTDICDELAGKYPKDFQFKGWHPHCLCYALPILKSEEEFLSLDDEPSINAVTDVPDNFKLWVRDNSDRIISASEKGKLPYFLRDNQDSWNKVLFPERHEQGTARNNSENTDIVTKPYYGSAMKLGRNATKEAMKIVENIGAPVLTDAQKKNLQELADVLGVLHKDIKPMTFLDADNGASNPLGDDENCQSVVIAFEARRRGINCYALPYSDSLDSSSFKLGERFQDAWINPKNGKVIEPTICKGKSDSEIILKLKKGCSSDGRYVLGINYNDGTGHVVSIDKINESYIIKDEQINTFYELSSFENIAYVEFIKIDKAIFNIELIKSAIAY